MRRFSSSLFAMFNSALTFDKLKDKNKDATWIFDQKHGYGEFKKQEFKIDGADRKNEKLVLMMQSKHTKVSLKSLVLT
ncbi:hypothetical protein [Mycoplasmopsis agalactiae]|uniref:hypothetical protein n=1 Tax=Mycoplasmopsis agalactiae TaxID=2110 RepID=UPI001F451C1E|nr:hypothetical protein [Mycoplasmopsis agalactiae]